MVVCVWMGGEGGGGEASLIEKEPSRVKSDSSSLARGERKRREGREEGRKEGREERMRADRGRPRWVGVARGDGGSLRGETWEKKTNN